MVIIPSRRIAFAHVPRTGGMSLSRAITVACPDAAWDYSVAGMHISAQRIRLAYPGWTVFSVVRSPWEIYASHYGWLRRYAREYSAQETSGWPDWYRDVVLRRAAMPFDALVEELIETETLNRPGGFWATYCDDSTVVFRYEERPYAAIGELLGVGLTLGVENESVDPSPQWTRRTASLVADYCHDDLERFGHANPVDAAGDL